MLDVSRYSKDEAYMSVICRGGQDKSLSWIVWTPIDDDLLTVKWFKNWAVEKVSLYFLFPRFSGEIMCLNMLPPRIDS